jgi:hypothetical protein
MVNLFFDWMFELRGHIPRAASVPPLAADTPPGR